MSDLTGADVVVGALKAAGVDTIFGVISIHNIPIFDAIQRQGGIRLVASRGEAGAVNMADAYARAGGRLGVAITSTGTGAGNACGALVEAQTAGSAVLHLTGQIETAHLDQGKGFIHEARDQPTTLRGVSKKAFRLTHAAALPGLLHEAMREALAAPRGPISIELPIDLQAGSQPPSPAAFAVRVGPGEGRGEGTPASGLPRISWRLPDRAAPAASDIASAAALLSRASRPLIFAGGGVIASDAGPELQLVAERLGAPVLTSNSGRGAIPEDHPLCVGNWVHSPALWPFLESRDAILIVGSHLRGNETVNWTAPLPRRAVQIDADPLALGRSYPVEIGIAADAKLALAQLAEHLRPREQPASLPAELETALTKARAQLEESLGAYAPMLRAMRAQLPRNGLFVRDVTVPASTWGNRLFPIYEPRTNIFPVGGGIGQGLQMAIGGQLAQPDRRVLCLAGDGGLMVNAGEMATAVQEGLPIVLVLFNDAGYGVLRNIQTAHYGGRHIGVDLRQPNFQGLARSMGWQSWCVQEPAAFDQALAEAFAAQASALVEIDMTAIGPIVYAGPPGRG
ncbi:MAG TPA: thiamine pyrophosphate-dependent enzyme [Chloroflexota bacterium]